MAKLIFTESYEKRVAKFLNKHPELLNQYEKVLKLLEINPGHPSLRMHSLKGKLSALQSVSVNMSYRITLYFIVKDDIIIPVDIGTHDQVY